MGKLGNGLRGGVVWKGSELVLDVVAVSLVIGLVCLPKGK